MLSRADQHAPAAWRRATHGVERFFYASSACVYAADKQTDADVDRACKEEDAYPAMPEDGYGWEKLFSERMCRHFREDFGLETRVARFHNVYGPYGTCDGGREKAPAAICRKVVEAKLAGDARDRDLGRRRADAQLHVHRRLRRRARSAIMDSDIAEPINLGSDELVTINQLVDIVEEHRRRQARAPLQPRRAARACAAATATTR